jgi:hypothetical protein
MIRKITDKRKRPHTDKVACWRIGLRCTREPKHAKIIELLPEVNGGTVRVLAEILIGNSQYFVHAPTENSLIGRCQVCRCPLTYEITIFGEFPDGKAKTSPDTAA